MIIVNTTFYVDCSIETEFLNWVRAVYVPQATLSQPSVARILGAVEEGMVAVAVRMHAPSVEAAMAWDNGEGALLRGVLAEKYGQKVLHFTTLMENIPL